jgi:hypothetical protein
MKTILNPTLTLALALSAFALVSCQTATTHSAGGDVAQCVMCDKCKTVFALRGQAASGGKYTVYRTQKVTTCPECETAVQHFIKTGHLQPYCRHCGGHMTCVTR